MEEGLYGIRLGVFPHRVKGVVFFMISSNEFIKKKYQLHIYTILSMVYTGVKFIFEYFVQWSYIIFVFDRKWYIQSVEIVIIYHRANTTQHRNQNIPPQHIDICEKSLYIFILSIMKLENRTMKINLSLMVCFDFTFF